MTIKSIAYFLRGHLEDVHDVAWSPNATRLISGSVDNSVIVWDTNKGLLSFGMIISKLFTFALGLAIAI